jgi:hypothetical protein
MSQDATLVGAKGLFTKLSPIIFLGYRSKCKIDKNLCNIGNQFEIYNFIFSMDSASLVFY